MAGPEDYVDAPADSPRAKLERQRKGKSKYGAIPEAIKKDPVGTTELLLAGFGVPEVKSGVESAKGVVATAEKAGDIASKVARFGQIKDPTTQAVQGVTVGKEVLNMAKDAGERKANSKVKPPGASSGALIAQGFDTGAPQQNANMRAAAQSFVDVPTPTPLAPGPTPVAPALPPPMPTSMVNPRGNSSNSGGGNRVLASTGGGNKTSRDGGAGLVGIAGGGGGLAWTMAKIQADSARTQAMADQAVSYSPGGTAYGDMVGSQGNHNRPQVGLSGMKKGGVIAPAKKLSAAQLIYRAHHDGQKEVGARA